MHKPALAGGGTAPITPRHKMARMRKRCVMVLLLKKQWGVGSDQIGVLIMVVVCMIFILLRCYFDKPMHTRMDTALKIVRAFAEILYVYTVPRMDHRSLGNVLAYVKRGQS